MIFLFYLSFLYCRHKSQNRQLCFLISYGIVIKLDDQYVVWIIILENYAHWIRYACVCVLSRFSHVQLCAPWIVAYQAPLCMGFPRQERWSELPCPPPGDLPNPGIEPTSLVAPALQADSLPLSHQKERKWKWSCLVVSDSLQPHGR